MFYHLLEDVNLWMSETRVTIPIMCSAFCVVAEFPQH